MTMDEFSQKRLVIAVTIYKNYQARIIVEIFINCPAHLGSDGVNKVWMASNRLVQEYLQEISVPW